MDPLETARAALARYYVAAALIKAGERVTTLVDLNGEHPPWFELTTPSGVRVRVDVEILEDLGLDCLVLDGDEP